MTTIRRSLAGPLLACAAGALAAWAPSTDVRATSTHQPGDSYTYDAPNSDTTVSVIGDSTLAGVRWYGDYGDLRRFDLLYDAESCRRTIEMSCISQEGFRSDTVVATMERLEGRLGEVVVIMSGYNDPPENIEPAIDDVVAEARRQGVDHVVWLTLRLDGVRYSDPQEQSSADTFREYNRALFASAASSEGTLQIADWAAHSAGARRWFETDGVHLTPRGVDGVTTFIADRVTEVLAGRAITPAVAPWYPLGTGDEGVTVAAVQAALTTAGFDAGGADGSYGTGTAAAVAEFQGARGLTVTGTVDAVTATALGVYGETPSGQPAPTTTLPPTTVPAPAPASVPDAPAAIGTVTLDDGRSPVVMIAAVAAVVSAVAGFAVAMRRRVVLARRRARRYARVHPATAPGRSIAELRRAGQWPPAETAGPSSTASASPPPGRIYDHQDESTGEHLTV